MKSGIKVLVFGGTGVIGTELIKKLKADGNIVTNVSKTTESGLADINLKMDLGAVDLTKMLELSEAIDVDIVYYLATYSTTDKMTKASLKQEAYILDMVIQAFNCSVRYASSYAVTDTIAYPKNDVRNYYREAKKEGEKTISFYANLDYDVVSFRIPAVYGGENNNRAMYKVINSLYKNETVELKKETVEFCYVEDVVNTMIDDRCSHTGLIQIPTEKINLKNLVYRLKGTLCSTSEIIDNVPISQAEVELTEHLLETIADYKH